MILETTIAIILALWALWVAFVAIMHLRRVRERWGLTTAQKALGYPLLIVGYALDVVMRLTVFCVLFVRPPMLETVSELLQREVKGDGWRAKQARWWREELLADFDRTGSHGQPGRQ
jgi:hypothetical protein